MRESEGWIQVSSRRKRDRGPNRIKNDNHIKNVTFEMGNDGITTCYVNNLPDGVTRNEVERKFARWGKVTDVYIARKRNRSGRIFGFVRYAGIKNRIWLENQLKDIWFGTYKTWVNISVYARKEQYSSREAIVRQSNSKRKSMADQRSREFKSKQTVQWIQGNRREGKSYADAIRNYTGQHNKDEAFIWRQKDSKEAQKAASQVGGGISITVNDEEMEWAKKGYVGVVRNANVIESLQQNMIEEGIVTVKVIPLGGEKVFLKIDEEENFRELLEDSKQCFNKWFSLVRPWEPRDVGAVRFLWCRIYGVPVHAWRKKVFSILTFTLGSLVKLDKINKESFDVSIIEEACDCISYEGCGSEGGDDGNLNRRT
ncbi:uncharacterized protein LOC131638270 [Vicia villosa]|uniref:uncharacterized protein LOC131638270 n=1 Tax=Vicia villosa TaxID=3911 RepID=UPI00273B1E49|nr:uncharacterized protein LOC131638270 [Vicia villosa]